MKKTNQNMCNHKDHQVWSRRSFLQSMGLVGAGTLSLANSSIALGKQTALNAAINEVENDNILIIVRLFGGNDALNMVVPINQYDNYANYRPNLKIEENNIWNLSDEYGMPNYMSALEGMWGEGKMKIVHSVGYENHSQSHFKGTDIWNTADPESQQYGWLGKYYEDKYPNYLLEAPTSPVALQIGGRKNLTFQGSETDYSFAVSSISRLSSIANEGVNYSLEGFTDCAHDDLVKFMRSTANNAYEYSDVIYDAYNNSTDYTGGAGYGTDEFASSLSVIARLIKGGLGTKVFMVTLDGFDTHSNQLETHQELLTNLSNSLTQFHEDLTDAGWGDKVLSMMVSEFGRRVRENASSGTDHGTACPVVFFGEGVNESGFIGQHASLEDDKLVNGRDLDYHTDFRNVYATVLKDWMCVDEAIVNDIVLEGEFESLDLGFECKNNSLSVNENKDKFFTSKVIYQDKNTFIEINNDQTQHVSIRLYSMNGQDIGLLKNVVLSTGKHRIDVNATFNYNLSSGYYIYKIETNRSVASKKLVIY